MILKFIFKRQRKKLQEKSKKNLEINNWMNLSKEQRLEMDFQEKNEVMKKKKALLKSIREEYFKIKKK